MGLSAGFLEEHISAWEQKLNSPWYPHRKNWPSRLFHHAPLENAVSILKSGELLSRADSSASRDRDVAAPGVIEYSERAHGYVRLYFRPRTPTQYHIEGIRKPAECTYGVSAHAPVLVMFVFDARSVLGLDQVRFSSMNMQTGTLEGESEDYFTAIPFEKVYHEGGIAGDYSIIKHRCAEVLAPSPMPLSGKLQWIYCRSSAERATLIGSLGELGSMWAKRILISDDLKVFDKRYTYVDKVSLSNDGVTFELNPRHDLQKIAVDIQAWDAKGNQVINFRNDEMLARPTNAPAWIVRKKLGPGKYRVVVKLEDHPAYNAVLTIDDVPF